MNKEQSSNQVATKFIESVDGIKMPLLKMRKQKFNKMFIELDVLMQFINESTSIAAILIQKKQHDGLRSNSTNKIVSNNKNTSK